MTYVFSGACSGVNESFSLLEEAYHGYNLDNLELKVGRQEMSTPLIDSDDYFVTPNSFEAVTLNYKIDDILFQGGYVSKMAGTWDASYDGSKFLSMSRQPWIHKADKGIDTYPVDEVYNIVGNSGISYASITYNKNEHKMQLWDFYAHNMLNTLFMQYDYTLDSLSASLQYSNKRAIGKLDDTPLYDVNYDVYGAKLNYKISNDWKLTGAYTGVSDDDSLHFFGSWGGYPEFASGMMVSYFETSLRDANIYALTSSHNLDSIMDRFSITLKYAYYDLNKDYTINTQQEHRLAPNGQNYMHAYGVGFYYSFSDDLSFKLMLAGRELENGYRSELIRTVLKYNF